MCSRQACKDLRSRGHCRRLTPIKARHGQASYGPTMVHKKFPSQPANPHRLCWGCDKYCAADSMACGNGSVRTQHPVELFGEDWQEWGLDGADEPSPLAADLNA